jgi:hypothetical protein
VEIISAGVDAGAKIFVGLSGRLAHAAAAAWKIGTVLLIIVIVATQPAPAHVWPSLINEAHSKPQPANCKDERVVVRLASILAADTSAISP